jgi:predicted aspartyl protease
MKSTSAKWPVRLSLIFILYALSGQLVHAGSSLRFRLIGNHLVVVSARINNEGPFDFILDTGTTSTIVTNELARRVNLVPVDNISLITLRGTRVVPRAIVGSFTLGDEEIRKVEVLYDKLEGVRAVDTKISGIVGQNVLLRLNFLIKYRECLIEFTGKNEHVKVLNGTSLQVEQSEGKLIVSAKSVFAKGGLLKLVLDSGASDLVIFSSASSKAGLDSRHAEDRLVATNSAGDVRTSLLKQLEIGLVRLVNLPVALVQEESSEGRPEDGLLPTSLFHTIYFQNDKHLVVLNAQLDH